YGYRLLTHGDRGAQTEVSWVDVPAAARLGLEGAIANPVIGAIRVAFTLPDASAARLELIDVAGRRRITMDAGALGAGRHVLAIGDSRRLEPGMYQLRLVRGEEEREASIAIVR